MPSGKDEYENFCSFSDFSQTKTRDLYNGLFGKRKIFMACIPLCLRKNSFTQISTLAQESMLRSRKTRNNKELFLLPKKKKKKILLGMTWVFSVFINKISVHTILHQTYTKILNKPNRMCKYLTLFACKYQFLLNHKNWSEFFVPSSKNNKCGKYRCM